MFSQASKLREALEKAATLKETVIEQFKAKHLNLPWCSWESVAHMSRLRGA